MTFSILAHDPSTGQMGGAAATGSLCVGGWVLRGDPRAGMSASQGAAPSTLWGEDLIIQMHGGVRAEEALRQIVSADPGRDWRQASALDLQGNTAAHTGHSNNDWRGHLAFTQGIVAGNILAGPHVLQAMIDGFMATTGPLHARLMQALEAANNAEAIRGGCNPPPSLSSAKITRP